MRILVAGGAGYVGSRLVPRLLKLGHFVTIIDLFWYEEEFWRDLERNNSNLSLVKEDLRNFNSLGKYIQGHSAVIHLACISNDPSFDLDPLLGKSINLDSFPGFVQVCNSAGVERFIYASSSSVYGVKLEDHVTEDLKLEPLTDYSKYKAICEDMLFSLGDSNMAKVVVRPATICGYAPRQRLDLAVNILANHAINKGEITVLGGSQFRPNLHIDDMVAAYEKLLTADPEIINGEVFNIGGENLTITKIASIVREEIGDHVKVNTQNTNDLRSYRIDSTKASSILGFNPIHNVRDAVTSLKLAFEKGLLPNSMTDARYVNILRMKELKIR
jgi:nucleoside-diphosphate-sugar epimerase